jgi:hypothetical protein
MVPQEDELTSTCSSDLMSYSRKVVNFVVDGKEVSIPYAWFMQSPSWLKDAITDGGHGVIDRVVDGIQ